MNDYEAHNPADDVYTNRTPADDLIEKEEPDLNTNTYRECALNFTRIMTLALAFIIEGEDSRLRTLGVIYALGLADLVGGRSMRDVGRSLGYSSGTISLNCKRFKEFAGLPDISQHSKTRVEKARDSRINTLYEPK
jgi:hypothetical protein